MENRLTSQPTKADAQKALLGMFTCFNLAGTDLERKARHDAYWTVLAGLPLNAVIAACRDAACGNLGDGCFVPTAAMLYQRAVSYLPKATIKLQQEPESVIPPDERAKVAVGFTELAKELARTNAALPPWPETKHPSQRAS